MSPLLAQAEAERRLRCPSCHGDLGADRSRACMTAGCARSGRAARRARGLPILVPAVGSAFDESGVADAEGESYLESRSASGLFWRVFRRLAEGQNRFAEGNARRFVDLVRESSAGRPTILVVGGGAIGAGLDAFYADPSVDLLAFDVYASPNVQFIADAHFLPLADAAVDGVVIQAVLSNVVDPPQAVAEIWRVLRPGGIVFSEVPFLQPVLEGPYDFFRVTESGHRWLYRHFEAIDSGRIGGPGTAAHMSITQLVRSLTRSRLMSGLARVGTGWMRALDGFCDDQHGRDGAAGTYFLGRRAETPIGHAEAIAYYRGARGYFMGGDDG